MTSGDEKVTLMLNVASSDNDGSEQVIRVVVSDVPDGVSVQDAEYLGDGTWVLIYDGTDAISVDDADGVDVSVVLVVGSSAPGLNAEQITVTVQTQDRGDEPDATTDVLSDSVTFTLSSEFEEGESEPAPIIDTWEYTDASATEDTSFVLSDMLNAEVTALSTSATSLVIQITDLPDGASVTGMVSSVINGETVWTASITTEDGDDADAVQAALDTLLDSIEIQVDDDANDNNMDESFSFSATLTTSVDGSGVTNSAAVTPEIPVDAVTDDAELTVILSEDDGDGVLTEADTSVTFTLTVSNTADGDAGSIVDGTLYLKIDGTDDLGTGTVTLDGTTYEAQTVTDVDGIDDGTYYVIEDVEMDEELDFVYTPDTMTAGSVTINSWVENIETGSTSVTSTGTTTLTIDITNEGVTFASTSTTESDVVTGTEAADSTSASLIELDLDLLLTDSDGSEEILTVLLSNLPEGFLVYTGTSEADASSAEMAVNAGGSDGTNTWVLVSDGDTLPTYVAILAPQNWSGTLDDLVLSVTSGETELSETRTNELTLGTITITAVANGVDLTPTTSFGTEGDIVSLNLNAAMEDSDDASVTAAADESVETTTLEIQGLGEYASFYVDSTILTSDVSYDSDTDTYTLTGLSQSDLDGLGFIQASDALTDQDDSTSGVQLSVTAWTEDGADVSDATTSTATVSLTSQLATTGDDSLLWTGSTIDGNTGDDTVTMRYGESLSGDDLALNLSNIETIDMEVSGSNSITDLTPDDVEDITDSDNTLSISGLSEDSLYLSGEWSENDDGSYTGTTSDGDEVTLTLDDVLSSDSEDLTSSLAEEDSTSSSTSSDASDSVDDSTTSSVVDDEYETVTVYEV